MSDATGGSATSTAFATEHENGIVVITFDLKAESVNKFTKAVKEEFVTLLQQLERDPTVRACVFVSGKPHTFIAGADIDEFLEWRSAADAEAASREGHALLDRLERSRLPFVIAIHGACLGGGLELALACSYRIATDDARTVLALPEVQLGLIPGAGGTQRLPRLVGARAALDMILTGKNVRAKKALQLGLVNEMVHPAMLRATAVQRADEIASGRLRRGGASRARGATDFALDDNPLGRAVVWRKARAEALAKTRGHYPAPLAAIEAVQAGFAHRETGFREEARRFGELAMSPESRELVFLFFATTALKKDVVRAVPARPVERLGVIGAGFMGAGIAAVAAQNGIPVRLKDADTNRVGHGLAAVAGVVKERLRKRQITERQFLDTTSLVTGTADYSGFRRVDCVIEAVFEDLALKQRILKELEPLCTPDTILASNTSTLPIGRIADVAQHPERVVGMHFFSPVHKMPLLEVVVTPMTADGVVTTAVAFGRRLGKTVIVVNDAPGFYVNRILAPYLNEAGRLLELGTAVDAVDAALVAFGFPVGPFTLLDEVGLDVAGKSGVVLHEAFGDRMAPAMALRRLIESGRTGRKGRSGFYRYDEHGVKGAVDDSVYSLVSAAGVRSIFPDAEMRERCVLPMLNEAVRALESGVVRSPRDGDVGAVFGIGFPPFRGGPFRYIDALGPATVVRQLEELNHRHPGRFEPCDLLLQMARKDSRFYPAGSRGL